MQKLIKITLFLCLISISLCEDASSGYYLPDTNKLYSGIIAYLPFQTNFNDYGPLKINASPQGNVVFSTIKTYNAVKIESQYQGQNSYINLPKNAQLITKDILTISFFVKLNNWQKVNNQGTNTHVIYSQASYFQIFAGAQNGFQICGNNVYNILNQDMNPEEFYHQVYEINLYQGKVTLYQNGALINSVVVDRTLITNIFNAMISNDSYIGMGNLDIQGNYVSQWNVMNGYIAEFIMYNRSLVLEEVSSLYKRDYGFSRCSLSQVQGKITNVQQKKQMLNDSLFVFGISLSQAENIIPIECYQQIQLKVTYINANLQSNEFDLLKVQAPKKITQTDYEIQLPSSSLQQYAQKVWIEMGTQYFCVIIQIQLYLDSNLLFKDFAYTYFSSDLKRQSQLINQSIDSIPDSYFNISNGVETKISLCENYQCDQKSLNKQVKYGETILVKIEISDVSRFNRIILQQVTVQNQDFLMDERDITSFTKVVQYDTKGFIILEVQIRVPFTKLVLNFATTLSFQLRNRQLSESTSKDKGKVYIWVDQSTNKEVSIPLTTDSILNVFSLVLVLFAVSF